MRNHPTLGLLIEGADSEWKRDRTVDVLVFVLCGGIAEEHRAKTAQLLIELISLLIDRVGQGGGQAIVSATAALSNWVQGKDPAPMATCARREKLLLGIILPGKGAPVVGSMGIQNVVALGMPPAVRPGISPEPGKITTKPGGIGNIEGVLIDAVANAPAFVVHQEEGLVAPVIHFRNVDRPAEDEAELILSELRNGTIEMGPWHRKHRCGETRTQYRAAGWFRSC